MEERKTRIVGQMMGRFLGKNVVVLGRVTKIGAGGNTIELTTLDNTKINITVPNTIEAKPTDILEVWGNVKSRGTMVATQCVIFTQEQCTKFGKNLICNIRQPCWLDFYNTTHMQIEYESEIALH